MHTSEKYINKNTLEAIKASNMETIKQWIKANKIEQERVINTKGANFLINENGCKFFYLERLKSEEHELNLRFYEL